MDKDILKKAAEILVASGYAAGINDDHIMIPVQVDDDGSFDFYPEIIDPFSDNLESRQQLDALFWYMMKGRDMYYLDGLGHLDHRE